MPELASKKQCTGCTACATACPKQCITMQADENGFVYPYVDNHACVQCRLCERACPVLHEDTVGQEPLAYAAYSTDEDLRMDSSSGGVFSELAKVVLEKNGVVYGAAYDERFAVSHIAVETFEDLSKLRGAKYAQSRLGHSFEHVRALLENGRQVLFSGTPCQVAGLKAFLRKEYSNLLCVDFVCHGVPSPMAWQAYVDYRATCDNGGQRATTINLRSKETGWSRYRYSNRFEYQNRVHTDISTTSLFMKLFVGDYISRESCSDCHFKGYSRVSDITIGDFWGIWDIAPEMDDDKGTSMVLLQSPYGQVAFDAIRDRLVCKEMTLEETSRHNGSMLVSSAAKRERETVLRFMRQGKIAKCQTICQGTSPSIVQRMVRKFRRLLKDW